MKQDHRHRSRPQIEIEIHDVAFGGSGVGRFNGKTVFLPFTIKGERVIAKIIEEKKHFDRARLVAVVRASPHRVSPPCPYFERCGGCDYQHLDYQEQLVLKEEQVKQILRRIGHLPEVPVLATIGSPDQFAFRNRITIHADDGRIGFFEKQSRRVLDIKKCAIARPVVNEKLEELRRRGLPDGAHRTLRENEEQRTFIQTNDLVAGLLLDYVANALTGDTLLDLYCGVGFMGHALANRFRTVVGIDWSEPAIAAARLAANSNETYLQAEVGQILGTTLQQYRPDSVILDPSSEGLDPRTLSALNSEGPPALAYVSCNPTTLARDLAQLKIAYSVISVQPFDMFPQTAEIEAVALMRRIENR